jgi:hypothetical protein
MAAKFCVDCGLPLTGRYCGACGRDYGATDAAQGMRTCKNLRTTTTTSRRTTSRRGWRRRDYLHPQTMMRILL